ncbi:transcriptional regulator, RpiR family [Catonella morbi ATCC 51271]|uniref:Transcriptional regulator, RpiR family n=2 Tax=Catonella TaxID=43996 RepID=V2XQK2_9FIRM|nr:transcriptional regulator, RpiR family [Catonella morbi ATCC 51271]
MKTFNDVGEKMNNYFFEYYQNETKQNIEKNFEDMTQLEKSIGEFFIKNKSARDFSSKGISGLLYVSEASLHRFAKKCGYKGYREFIFSYEKDIENERNNGTDEKKVNQLIIKLKAAYTTLVEENFGLIKDNQIRKIATLLNSGKRVILTGSETENAVFEEYKLKYLKLGIDINTVTKKEFLEPSVDLLNKDSLVIVCDISGENDNLKTVVQKAEVKEADIVLITANEACEYADLCNEVIKVSYPKGLANVISMQMVILMTMDVIYSYCSANKNYFKAIKKEKEGKS